MKKCKRYSPDAEMADILFQAALRQYAPLTADDIRGLTESEIRQLWLKRREEGARKDIDAAAAKPTRVIVKPPRPIKHATTRKRPPTRVPIAEQSKQQTKRRRPKRVAISKPPIEEQPKPRKSPGRHPHPHRAEILGHYRDLKARKVPNAAKLTAEWVEGEVKAGRMVATVHPDTIPDWDDEGVANG